LPERFNEVRQEVLKELLEKKYNDKTVLFFGGKE
jgi:hypothetical protein